MCIFSIALLLPMIVGCNFLNSTNTKYEHLKSISLDLKTHEFSFENRNVQDAYKKTTPEEYPYAVLPVAYKKEGILFSCTGNLLTPEWVLTAGHFIMDVLEENQGKCGIKVKVYAGGNSLRELQNNELAPGSQIRTSKSLYPHPKFSLHLKDFDVGLIKVSKFEMTKTVSVVKLSTQPWTYKGYYKCKWTGFGIIYLSRKSEDDEVRKTNELEFQNPCLCADRLSTILSPEKVKRYLCSMPKENYGSCRGDSGSGLICDGELKGTSMIRFHINDLKTCDLELQFKECKKEFTATVFEDTCPFVPWINSHVKLFNESEISPKCHEPSNAIIRLSNTLILSFVIWLIINIL